MSEVKVNKISPRTNCGTTTLGDSGDTFTVPSGVTISNSGTATGFGRTGTVDWVTTVKVTGDSPITAATGSGYFLNTTAGAITINLPAGAAGSIVSIADYAGTWATNKVTVAADGSEKIGGSTVSPILSTDGQSVTLVYIDATQGWVTTADSTENITGNTFVAASVSGACNTLATIDTDYKIATFKGPGTFSVCSAGTPAGSTTMDYLVVAGGGASGACTTTGNATGGGGGGGWRASATTYCNAGPSSPLTPTSGPTAVAALTAAVQDYPITVGGGGAATPNSCGTSTKKGSDSSFDSITSTGGGGGGFAPPGSAPTQDGGPGGSGGGSASEGGASVGSGNTPSTSPAQGTNGGAGADGSPSAEKGGGAGGGAIVAGGAATHCSTSGVGGAGAGIPNNLGTSGQNCGSYYYFSGGGGGGIAESMPTGGAGGIGGGGAGGNPGSPPAHPGVAGTCFTGGGGGGNKVCVGGTGQKGGSGIVIIRYKFQ